MKKLSNRSLRHTDFQDLMPHRVHEILLVASPYDAFILEEDGRLTEQILTEYLGMNFNYAPRVNRVSTALDALENIKSKKFDLIIVMLRIEDQDPLTLGTIIKKKYPKKPIILLSFDESELKQLPDFISPESIDRVFIWSGDASVFPAIIKHTEDRKNAKLDISRGNVRAILLIEDSPRMYSILLPLIYREIVYQTKGLVDKSLNHAQRLLHLRGRPKILLAVDYESAERYYKRYGKNVIGVISDIRFPRKNKLNPQAGFQFIEWIRSIEPTMPVMLYSDNKNNQKFCDELNLNFLYKGSKTMLSELRNFIIRNFGFGDFIFRLPDDTEVAKARNISELAQCIESVPEDSLLFHAKSNHFSNWLAARTEFNLATKLRPIDNKYYNNGDELRDLLTTYLKSSGAKQEKGSIIDYTSDKRKKTRSNFYRLSGGSLGGKARGIAFAQKVISDSNLFSDFKNFDISIPTTAVIGTDEFDRFMKDNDLWEKAINHNDDADLEKLFLKSHLSLDLSLKLESFIKEHEKPLAVRSSSLLEDSQYQPLSGTYSTFMLPNNQENIRQRLLELESAIKKVYASTFKRDAKALLNNTSHRSEEEKMAVIIMEIAGQKYRSNRFYPTISGVLKNINYYPVSYMKRKEGIAYLALGFGRTIVDGEKSLRVSPKYPNILPQFYSSKTLVENSQNQFYALDLKENNVKKNKSDLAAYTLSDAETDGSLKWLASVLSNEDNVLRDSLNYSGKRILSFAPILKINQLNLPNLLMNFLKIGRTALGCPVEIEFAINLYKNKQPKFSLLQIKPMVLSGLKQQQESKKNIKDLLCKSSTCLGDGLNNQIQNILYIRPDTFKISMTKDISNELETFNKSFIGKRKYILAGPGRWGSTDPWLGIPVSWRQISEAKLIVEIGTESLPIDPSFGSHFFQNLTSLHIGYFTIDKKKKNELIDYIWLSKQKKIKSGKYIDHYHFETPLSSYINGQTGEGYITKPLIEKVLVMNEEESTGI
ncbi:MAG: hypothetical protein CMG04_08565 [Candidatus Marinimicrobia bacterium]|nr:hypothetical protein [Candidatus Neomarinimicrobiota bacterium]